MARAQPSTGTSVAPTPSSRSAVSPGLAASRKPFPAQSLPGASGGNAATGVWLPLSSWAQSRLGPRAQAVALAPAPGWRLETPLGWLRLAPDTRQAWLDGIAFWLGFAPIDANGGCLVHELDLRKNLEPLFAPAWPSAGRRIVVIDPGHGGENTGTHSVLPHLVEKQLTLDWALRLEPLLRQQGWQVILTRTTDVDVSLAERVSVAERVGADLFVSLHFNSAYPQSDLKGPETYCLTPVGMPSTLTRNYEDDVSREFPNNRHDDQNVLCAFRLHRALVEASGGLDRGLRRARFMGVLRGQNRPAVLLEAGYLSNPDEAARIGSPDYRQRLAEAVARALRPTPSLARDNPRGGHPGEAAP